ncbi:hypothetical protein [Devosia sp.]|uniref:hypothetical protein n=1 Tax=Devosia sp. TaxID=1871048 RepID=UPI001AD3F821|nr:hypothetical protein [Devosia sp.]MBN9334333.1 hypothetical protein [Devosia sp.]
MRAFRFLVSLALATAPAGCMFLAQTWLLLSGQGDAVLDLARYGGLIGLIFLAFDGGSGLAPTLMRQRHAASAIRSAYLVYRGGVLAVLLAILPLAWLTAPVETLALLPLLAAALLLRLPLLDADLDRHGWQHWSMALQNGWMLPLAVTASLTGEMDARTAGHAALWSTLALFAAHHLLVREKQQIGGDFRPPLIEIVSFACAQGIGQAYGRAVMFILGAAFTGPLPALVIYAKQAFNAAGPLVNYLRRIELAQSRADMKLSLSGQTAICLVAGALVALAAARLGLPLVLALTLIAWQIFEKLSANAVYAHQIAVRHRLALGSLVLVASLGLFGLAVADGQPLVFIAAETIGYAIVLILWLPARRQPFNTERRP